LKHKQITLHWAW